MSKPDYLHVLLYAKGCYQESDSVVDDLAAILMHRSWIDRINHADIWGNMVTVLCNHSNIHEIRRDFLDVLFQPNDFYERFEKGFFLPNASFEECLGKILSNLRFKKIEGIDFDDADENVLPLSAAMLERRNTKHSEETPA
jgi:hypothetical protein